MGHRKERTEIRMRVELTEDKWRSIVLTKRKYNTIFYSKKFQNDKNNHGTETGTFNIKENN